MPNMPSVRVSQRTAKCHPCNRKLRLWPQQYNRAGGVKCLRCGSLLEVLPVDEPDKWERNPLWFMNRPEPEKKESAREIKRRKKLEKRQTIQGTPPVQKPPQPQPSQKIKPLPTPQRTVQTDEKGRNHHALNTLRDKPEPGWWLLRFDGSCEGNGSRHATGKWGFHLQDETFHTIATGNGITVAEVVTNNVSEWNGVLHGLKAVASQKVEPAGLVIEGDSMLVVSVLSGRWASKKPELTELRDECRDLIASLDLLWSCSWIPREENEYCDELTRP